MHLSPVHLSVSYRWPVHTMEDMEGFAHLEQAKSSLPVTEALADEIFSLPRYPSLCEEQQTRGSAALREVLRTV